MADFYQSIQNAGIVPVVKINDAAMAVGMADALLRGGLPVAEITFRSGAAEEAIRQISKNVPGICVCAGTVLSVETAKRAADAGAKAIISPGTNPEVVLWCIENGIPVIPGCATPSDVERCLGFGLSTVKLFPAEVLGGVKMLKALAGPYQDVLFMPTGGVSPQNVKDYLALKNVLACGGSWIAPESLIDAGDFEKIAELAGKSAEIFHSVRG
jgi:2-dehydro-3-deoxyphosphogluconate aldolase / (4S)-4-hydroxy-2-oxoglutarate aldolase